MKIPSNYPKRVFPFWNRKREHHHEILRIRISLGIKFQLKLTILSFWTKFTQKKHFQWKTEKRNITIEYCIFEVFYVPSFHLNWQFSFFGFKFAQNGYFWSKMKKMNITIAFCIFQLVWVPNFTLHKQIWILGPNLPKKGIFGLKEKKWTPPQNFACPS